MGQFLSQTSFAPGEDLIHNRQRYREFRLFRSQQPRLLRLILGVGKRSGVPCLLEVDELLAERCVRALGIAVSDGNTARE